MPLGAIYVFAVRGGLSGFLATLRQPDAQFALRFSLLIAFSTSLLNGVLGTFAAYVLAKHRFRGREALSVIVNLPVSIPTVVVGTSLLLLWGPIGLLGEIAFRMPDADTLETSRVGGPPAVVSHEFAYGTIVTDVQNRLAGAGFYRGSVDGYLTFLSNFGLAFLFFFAGLEVVEKRVARRSLVLGTAGWGISRSTISNGPPGRAICAARIFGLT
jgi:ABC-type Fe3+ transport system permease subunit